MPASRASLSLTERERISLSVTIMPKIGDGDLLKMWWTAALTILLGELAGGQEQRTTRLDEQPHADIHQTLRDASNVLAAHQHIPSLAREPLISAGPLKVLAELSAR